jgi:hypothetical protein
LPKAIVSNSDMKSRLRGGARKGKRHAVA